MAIRGVAKFFGLVEIVVRVFGIMLKDVLSDDLADWAFAFGRGAITVSVGFVIRVE